VGIVSLSVGLLGFLSLTNLGLNFLFEPTEKLFCKSHLGNRPDDLFAGQKPTNIVHRSQNQVLSLVTIGLMGFLKPLAEHSLGDQAATQLLELLELGLRENQGGVRLLEEAF